LRLRFRYRHAHVLVAAAAHAKGFTLREVETLFQSRHAGKSFIKDWPVKLVTEVCMDTAKAFVELRLLPQRVNELDEFARIVGQAGEKASPGFWQRLERQRLFMREALRNRLITRRARQMYDVLMITQWASAQQVLALQELRLRRLIRHAYHHVPYYREVFDRMRIRPEQIATLSDLQRLPRSRSMCPPRPPLTWPLLSSWFPRRQRRGLCSSRRHPERAGM
ncbi:MAG TPA: hypothetical protein VKE51_07340, partial [Vicinamibacterales bacterium]|nr:hypothetical protein [Vicinamibacterales bacterium]